MRKANWSVVHHNKIHLIGLQNFVKFADKIKMPVKTFLFVKFAGNKNAKIKIA